MYSTIYSQLKPRAEQKHCTKSRLDREVIRQPFGVCEAGIKAELESKCQSLRRLFQFQ